MAWAYADFCQCRINCKNLTGRRPFSNVAITAPLYIQNVRSACFEHIYFKWFARSQNHTIVQVGKGLQDH